MRVKPPRRLGPRVRDADRCVLERKANRHLGFGAGVHRCLGSNPARLEFHIGLEQSLSRMPDYTLAPGAQAAFPEAPSPVDIAGFR